MTSSLRSAADPRVRGQALAEFAIALPVFLLLVFGLIDGGRMVIDYSTLANASRNAARVAIVNQSNDATDCSSARTFKCAAMDHSAAMGIDASSIDDLAALDAETCEESGCDITVTVRHTYEPITPLPSIIFGTFEMEASTTMPIERLYSDP